MRMCGRFAPHRSRAAWSSEATSASIRSRCGRRSRPDRWAASSLPCASTTGRADPVDCMRPTKDSAGSSSGNTCRYRGSRAGSGTSSGSRKGTVARYPVHHRTWSTSSSRPSVKRTRCPSKRSMPARTPIRPAATRAGTVSLSVGWSWSTPSGDGGSAGPSCPRAASRSIAWETCWRSRHGRTAASAPFHWSVGRPSSRLGSTHTPRRADSSTSPACPASSVAMSIALLPVPTTSTRRPANAVGSRYAWACEDVPAKVPGYGGSGRRGVWLCPFATTRCATVSSNLPSGPSSSSSQPSPVRRAATSSVFMR